MPHAVSANAATTTRIMLKKILLFFIVQRFKAVVGEVSEVERDVEIMKATPDDVIGVLSGEEIMAIDWMMEHGGE